MSENATNWGIYEEPKIRKGTSWNWDTFQYVDEEDVAINLTGSTVRLKIYNTAGQLKKTLTSGSGLTVTANQGLIQPVLNDSDSNLLGKGSFPFEILVTTSGGTETNIIFSARLEIF